MSQYVVDKLPVSYNIGHLVTAEGDSIEPDGNYLVALNKLSKGRHLSVGPSIPESAQLIDISGDKMKLVHDGPAYPEPHDCVVVSRDKIHPEKIMKRGGKWGLFLLVSLLLSHTFLSYFMPVHVVFEAVVSPPSAHPTAFTFILIFTAIIYWNYAWFREQMCIAICPYGRLQGALYDEHTVNVGYDKGRGEPRGRQATHSDGDCIDCFRCCETT